MTDPKAGVSLIALCAGEPETDIGNGRRFLHRFGDRVLHVANIGWHGFDGLRWREDEDGSVVRPLAHKTAESIVFECEEILFSPDDAERVEAGENAELEMKGRKSPDAKASSAEHRAWNALVDAVKLRDEIVKALEDRRSARARHAKSTAGTSKLSNMLLEASPYRAATVDKLNPDRMALNCLNGTLRFERVEDEESDPEDPRFNWHARLDPHRREDLISKIVDVEMPLLEPGGSLGTSPFSAFAEGNAPTFLKFFREVQPNPDHRSYLQRLCGYMLTGLTTEQQVTFFYGIGANGKSTFTDIINRILGDYSVTLSIDSFAGDTRRGGGDATPDLVRLMGARACFASEGDQGVQIREGLIKLLTGGDRLPVRRLNKEFVEIDIQAKVVITGNHKPTIRNDDDGIWRRLHLVDWPVQIRSEDRDRHLPDKLWAERAAILAWMVAGAIEFLTLGGLCPPQSILDMTQEHREESDPIGAFLRSACEITGVSSDEESPGSLYAAYVLFCQREGQFAFNQATFTRRLPEQTRKSWRAPGGEQKQFVKVKNAVTKYRGIRVKIEFRGGSSGPVGGGSSSSDYPDGYSG